MKRSVFLIRSFLFVYFCYVASATNDNGTEEPFTKDDDTEYVTDGIPDVKSTETIKRVLDLNSPGENKAQSLLEETLKQVDARKFLVENINSATASEKPNNIQRVAKKLSLMDGMIDRLDSDSYNMELVNVSSSDVQWLTRIFNVMQWDPENVPGRQMLSPRCDSLMRQYLRAFHNGSVWANKMIDSTGRYSSQFFFGNDFWLGSRTECRELQNKNYNRAVPPFTVHFYVSKFLLKLQHGELNYTRLLMIGLCLPKECTTNDIKTMLHEDSKGIRTEIPTRSVTVLSVRAVPGPYSIYADKKLHLLLMILSVVIVLTVIGTCYEVSLQRKRNRWYRKHQASVISNNNEGDMKIITPLEKLPGLEMKIENGYSVKNNSNTSIPESNYSGGGESAMSQFILSFSAISNSKKILYVGATPEESLTCVHGLRFLSLAWVIMVHTYLQVFTIAENKALRTLAERNFMFQTVSNATFSVDSFFFISGLLVTYLYFKSARKEIADKGRRPKNPTCMMNVGKFLKLVGYRFLRLTPAYMFVLLIAEISMRWIHNWSVFEPISQNHVSCDKYWWRNILYINSLFPMNDMCMLWSWYVSNDTQFYVFGIIILLLSIRYFRFSAFLLVLSLFLSWGVTISISLIYDFRAKIEDPFMLFDQLYDKPWTRLGPYLVGMFTGWFIFKTKAKLNVSKITVLVSWILAIFTHLFLVYGLHVFPLGAIGSAIYVSVGHTAWAVALAWMVIACCSGHGGFIDSFLSFRLLFPLSRLTYCAYLVHPIIMTTTNFQMNAPLHLQDSTVVILYFGNILASFISSFCISLLFEAPVVRLLKIIFSPQPRKTTKNQTTL